MSNHEIDNLKLIAKSWNSLDISYIEAVLADDLIYESQWVLVPIEGKESYLSYLNSKFQAIKAVMNSEPMNITAELTLHPSIQNKPGIVITQVTKDGIRQVSLLIKIQKSKIKRIDVCFIPDPAEATIIDKFPI
jgi:hypothetical protein